MSLTNTITWKFSNSLLPFTIKWCLLKIHMEILWKFHNSSCYSIRLILLRWLKSMVVHDLHSLSMFLFFIYFSFHFDHFLIFKLENFSLYIPTHIIALFFIPNESVYTKYSQKQKRIYWGADSRHTKKKSHDFLIRKKKFRFIFIFFNHNLLLITFVSILYSAIFDLISYLIARRSYLSVHFYF